MRCMEVFSSIYRREAEGVAFAPYRVCPLGAHVDHNLGEVTGLALDRGVHIAYRPKRNGVIEMKSMQFEKRAQWHAQAVPSKEGDWADYLRGATLALSRRQALTVGLCGVIEGSLPIGGLSSSAAVTLSFLRALCAVNGIHLTEEEYIEAALEAERNYVGVHIGALDQSCAVLCRRGSLLHLDTRDGSHELIAWPGGAWKALIFFSGLERSLAGSGYNARVDELKAGAFALRAYAGMEPLPFEKVFARDVPEDVFERYKDRLPDSLRMRLQHFYGERARVASGADAWRRGDMEAFGALVFESGRSSIDLWQTGAPEQICLYEHMLHAPGVYGGRFCGAGFKGSCMALVDPVKAEEAAAAVTAGYLRDCPEMAGRFQAILCETGDGMGALL